MKQTAKREILFTIPANVDNAEMCVILSAAGGETAEPVRPRPHLGRPAFLAARNRRRHLRRDSTGRHAGRRPQRPHLITRDELLGGDDISFGCAEREP